MKKVILVDGNNLLFRSYYATAYNGNFMKNSKGFPTNGLYGFVNMINKILNEENPAYMLVAFDVGKTFRHEKYEEYKGGRGETPEELKMQFPIAKKLLEAMGICYLEVVGYEADDIIGTVSELIHQNAEYEGLIVSSDKDLLQLIRDDVTVKLLKSKDYVMMDYEAFVEMYGIEPRRMIDLKGLMGDASDNIPGVKGIGEKTALKLLKEYDTVENLYDHIDDLTGAVKNKLENGRKAAFDSKELATIYKEVPLGIELSDMKYHAVVSDALIDIYNELEFYSFIKKVDVKRNEDSVQVDIVKRVDFVIDEDCAVYLDFEKDNYHKGKILGLAIYNSDYHLYIEGEQLKDLSFIKGGIYTYDAKKLYVVFRYLGYVVENCLDDMMIAGYLLNYNVKDDIAYLAHDLMYDMKFYDEKEELSLEERANRGICKAKFIYEMKGKLDEDMKRERVYALYEKIERPLAIVLGKMEFEGIRCDVSVLEAMGEDICGKLGEISKKIYDLAGLEFNIGSPKQLGNVLFDKLGLPHGKRGKSGNYSTDEATLSKLIEYPIVGLVLEYRMLSKLYSTYIEGLKHSIMDDGKIHTIYMQTLTRTGRLSSIEPNLQNIPIRSEYGRLIRKSFVSEKGYVLMSSDYSQIELRVFAHLADIDSMREAFLQGIDIHTKTASDVNHVRIDEVTKDMRRGAKAVNFGIIYGISSYGLARDLHISVKEAKQFIDNYYLVYPGIKGYMNKMIDKAYQCGYVQTIMGRKRVIDELKNTNYSIRSMGERMALNTPIQGSSADILKKAMIDIDSEFRKKNIQSKMLLQIHDELVFEVKAEEKDMVREIVQNVMENVCQLSVPLKVDVSFGQDLYEAK